MALHIIDGIPGSGKSYTVVNFFVLDYLAKTKRPLALTSNLGLDVDAVAATLAEGDREARGSAVARRALAESIRERITFLEDEERPVLDLDTGEPVVDEASGKPLVAHMRREFWHFTRPNSAIFIDEAADALNAYDHRAAAGTLLQSYINHHRHFKDDVFFICQDYNDLNAQVRRKFAEIYRCSNSLRENMFNVRLFDGLRWPIQLFFVRLYVRAGNKLELQMTWRQKPTKRGFGHYRSFSKSLQINGRGAVADEATSSDYGEGSALKLFLVRAKGLAFFGLLLGGMAFGVVHLVRGMLSVSSDKVPLVGGATAKAAGTPAGKPTGLQIGAPKPTGEDERATGVTTDGGTVAPEPERVLFVSGAWAVTNRGRYPLEAVPRDLVPSLVEFIGPLAGTGRREP